MGYLEKRNIFQVSIQERLRHARSETGIAGGALFVLIYCVNELNISSVKTQLAIPIRKGHAKMPPGGIREHPRSRSAHHSSLKSCTIYCNLVRPPCIKTWKTPRQYGSQYPLSLLRTVARLRILVRSLLQVPAPCRPRRRLRTQHNEPDRAPAHRSFKGILRAKRCRRRQYRISHLTLLSLMQSNSFQFFSLMSRFQNAYYKKQ